MGVRHPTTCVGLHVNFCVAIAPSPNSLANAWTLARFLGTFVLLSVAGSKADKAKLKGMRTFFKQETAYQMIQGRLGRLGRRLVRDWCETGTFELRGLACLSVSHGW